MASVETELLAAMMLRQGFVTGHGDSVEQLVQELKPQIERLRIEVSDLRAQAARERVKRCQECGSELSYCDEMSFDGPTLDCLVCRMGEEKLRLVARCVALEAERDELRRQLECHTIIIDGMRELRAAVQAGRDVMAAIHRDDGSYRELHGDRKAADDAIKIVAGLRAERDALREDAERYQ
jgi:hypothetical protein